MQPILKISTLDVYGYLSINISGAIYPGVPHSNRYGKLVGIDNPKSIIFKVSNLFGSIKTKFSSLRSL